MRTWSTKVKTRDLNDCWRWPSSGTLAPWAVGGKRIKPKYSAQTKARPPTFVLFSSRAEQMPEQYSSLPRVNSLRRAFDLPGVLIRLTLKSNKNPYAEGRRKGGAPSLQQGGLIQREKAKALAAEAKAARAEAAAEATGEPAPKPVKKTVVKLTVPPRAPPRR